MIRPVAASALLANALLASISPAAGIGDLTRHFNDPKEDYSNWEFLPKDNVAKLSTTELPGALVFRAAGKGTDVKGILADPIRIDQYPTPWFFKLAMIQDQDAVCGMVGSRTQVNYAFGINVAVTFSDPATWPKDRSQRPPDTHDVQLFVVHLGSTGEVSQGLPQYTTDQHPEQYLVWGRGDLGYSTMGDWRIPHVEIGNGMRDAGPASSQAYFMCRVDGPTSISLGVKFNSIHDYRMRHIDFSSLYGKATGIWEIGPIASGDRWIPDTLCRSIAIERGPEPFLVGSHYDADADAPKSNWISVPQPLPEPPQPNVDYLIDYMAFGSFAGNSLESFSDEFDIPGYLDRGRFQLYASRLDTYSHPGNLTLMKMGRSIECVAWGTPDPMRFKDFAPPWEIEACVIPPGDDHNWDVNLGFGLMNEKDTSMTYWYPGVCNLPVSKKRTYLDGWKGNERRPQIPLQFDAAQFEEALKGDRVFMLFQFLDNKTIRFGVKSKQESPWVFSERFDTKAFLGAPTSALQFVAWNASSNEPPAGDSIGFPLYQIFQFEYIRYHYGTTE